MTKDRQSHIEARDKRMKEALRANLQRRKQKSRALRSDKVAAKQADENTPQPNEN